jgi:ubiquinone/menaquinone biosynthesis C-methylase UbiE
VDISEAQVRLAQEMVPEGNFICADMTRLCFREGSFDAICSYYAIIHVPREEHAGILRDFYRILRPGGLALFCLGAGDLPESVEKYLNGVEMYWSHYDAKTNIGLLEECGFSIIWYRLVNDSTDPKSKSVHLFVLAEKREKAG